MRFKRLTKILGGLFTAIFATLALSSCSSKPNVSPNVLCLQFNDYLEASKEDGTHDQMVDYWFSLDSEGQTVDYQSLVDVNGTIRVGLTDGTEPFSYVANNTYSGLVVDMITRFAKKFGYALSFESFSNLGSLIGAVTSGIVDVGASATTITEERKKSVLFSNPYLNDETGIMIRKSDASTIKSISDLKNMKIGIQSGSMYSDYLDDPALGNTVMEFGTVAELCLALETNTVSAVVSDGSSIKLGTLHHETLTYFNGHLFDNLLGIMFNKTTYTTFDELEGKTIGILDEQIMRDNINAKIKSPKLITYGYDDWEKVSKDLKNGTIDAACTYIDVIRYRTREKQYYAVISESLYEISDTIVAANNLKNKEVIGHFNEFAKRNESNYLLNKLRRKWVNGFTDGIKEPPDYKLLPNKNGILKVVVEEGFDPYAITQNGKFAGVCIDYLSFFAEEYGYALEFSYLKSYDFSTVFNDGSDIFVDLGHIVNDSYGYLRSEVFGKNQVNFVVRDTYGAEQNIFQKIATNFKKTFIVEDRYKTFLDGVATTFIITILSILIGLVLGFAFFILIRNTPKISEIIYKIIDFIISGTPAVVFLMICYYIIFNGTNIGGMWVSVIAFSLIFMCSTVSFLKTGFAAVDKGQSEAAFTLGYSRSKAFTKILLPQAAKTFMPILKADIISHIKGTAIVGYIAVVDLTKASELIRSRTFDAFFSLIVATILYFILEYGIILLLKLIPVDPKKRKQLKVLKGVEEHDWV